MTIKELSNLTYLNIEIEREQQRLKQLMDAATDTSVKISGLPHASSISNKTAIAAEIADCEDIIKHKNREAIIEYNRIMRFIAKIDDSRIRQIITLRYIDGKTWVAIAMEIGGGNTQDSVKKTFYRYMEKN